MLYLHGEFHQCGWEILSLTYYVWGSRYTLPADWVPHMHPEGAVYFVNAKFNVVTDSQLYDSAQQAQMAQAITCFQYLLQESNVVLPRDYEVFLRPDGYNKCKYYLVDHEEHVQFWLEEVQSSDLGLPYSTSLHHLSEALLYSEYLDLSLTPIVRVYPTRALLDTYRIFSVPSGLLNAHL